MSRWRNARLVEVVRLVRLEHVRLEQRVVRDAAQRDAVIGEHVLVVLQVLAELRAARCRQATARDASSTCSPIQLRRRAGIAMAERNVSGARGRRRQRDADDLGRHRIGARRFDVDRHDVRARRSAAVQRSSASARQHRLVIDAAPRRPRGRAKHAQVRRWTPRVRVAGFGAIFDVHVRSPEIAQPALEFEALVQRAQSVASGSLDVSASTFRRQLAIDLHRQQPLCPAAASRARCAGSRRRRRRSRPRAR